jgi:hypothetical protein
MFSAILASMTSIHEGLANVSDGSTTTSGSFFTTELSLDAPGATRTADDDMQSTADAVRLSATITILATSTTAEDEQHMMKVLQRALKRSEMRVEDAINRTEQLQIAMQGHLGPTELVHHLRTVGILENDENLDESSFLEQGFFRKMFSSPMRCLCSMICGGLSLTWIHG